ncbi:glycosyltransferase family 2 protein [Brucella anthropi]
MSSGSLNCIGDHLMIPEHKIEPNATSSNQTACGIIVTYNPDLAALERLIVAVTNQLANLLVVDNGSADNIGEWLSDRYPDVNFIPLEKNEGIAKAQNVGIQWSKNYNFCYVLLLDQDSIPAPDMVATLAKAIKKKQSSGIAVACAGPRYIDPRQENALPFIQTKGFRLHRYSQCNQDDVVEVDYLIASGCLIPQTTLDVVGLMQEELFIDYVDIEWGLRAQKKGFQSFGVCAAYMEHQLGDEPLFFRGRRIPVHSPVRHYYHFRNAVWLYRRAWLRTDWKVVDALRLVRKFVFYSLMTPPRLRHFEMMLLGVWHGLIGRMGPK